MNYQSSEIQNTGSLNAGTVSILTPAYNEQANLPALHAQIIEVFQELSWHVEWIIIDDHSNDGTYAVIEQLHQENPWIKGLRLSRNTGSHTAISCGLDHASGDCAIIMAADLQDPPTLIPDMLAKWQDGYHIVWAARRKREGITKRDMFFSKLFYSMMRNIVGMKEMPASGADFFLLDRRVMRAFSSFSEKNLSILALITWMGFKQAVIYYDKQERLHGTSGWTLKKKINIIVDSITSFSFFPIRFMSLAGLLLSFIGFLYAGIVVIRALTGTPPDGWSSLMVVVLIIGGFQILMLGVLGEYLWRALDESRHRPRYLIEADIGDFPNSDTKAS